MSNFLPSGLRSRAILLVLLAIVPLLGLTIYSYLDRCERAIRELQREELLAARNLATMQEIVLQDSKKMLMTLAQMPEVQRRDREASNVIIAEMLKQTPYGMTIVAADAEGQMFASAPIYPTPVNYADRNWFKRARETKNLVIDCPVLGRISGKYGFSLVYPILDDEKQFMGTVSSQLDLQWLGNFLTKNNFPPAAGMALVDSDWNILFRYPYPEKYIGKVVPDFLVKAMTGSDHGVGDGVGLYGDQRLFAFARLSPPWQEMRVVVGFPKNWAVGPAYKGLVRNLFWLSLVAFLAVGAAWFGGDFLIVQPIKRLQTVTQRLAAGDLTVRSGAHYTTRELRLLSESFDQMADSLQGRTKDLRREKDFVAALLYTLGAVVVVLDHEGKIVHVNRACEEVSGFLAQELLGKSCIDLFIPPMERAGAWAELQKLWDNGITGTYVNHWVMRNGERRLFSWSNSVLKDDNGIVQNVISTGIDITERQRAEEDLRESEERLRAVFEQAAVGVGLANNVTGRFIKVNEKYCEIVGLTQEEFLSTTFMAITHPDDIQADLDNVKKMRQGLIRHFSREKRYIRKDGSIVWVNVTISDIWKLGKPTNHNIVVVEDIRERKQAEEKLRLSELDLRHLASQLLTAQEQERKRISYALHDDVGQSLTVLKMRLRAAGKHLPEENNAKEEYEWACECVDHIIETVRRVSYALSPSILEDLGLTKSLKVLFIEACKLHNIKCNLHVDNVDDLFSLETQINIYRIFQEILNNILKHAQADRIEFYIKSYEEAVNFSVIDNGVGFKVEEILADRGQHGLGLASIKERVRIIGGSFSIKSKNRKGSVIDINVPIAPSGHG